MLCLRAAARRGGSGRSGTASFRISAEKKRRCRRQVLKKRFSPQEKLTKEHHAANEDDNQYNNDCCLHNVTIILIKNIERYKYVNLYKVVPDRHIPL